MPHNINRRDFLRCSAAALAALWLAPLLPMPAGTAVAAPRQRPAAASAPAFEPLPAPVLLGAPIDVAVGTDGVLWALGESGAPSTYDPLGEAWLPYGGGIDAAAYVAYRDANDNDVVAASYFRGDQVLVAGEQNPVAIAGRWPGPPALPASFQGGLDGAAGRLYGAVFFRQGQAAFVTDSGETAFVQPLSGFTNWPDGAWEGGRFDYVISGRPPGAGQAASAYFVLGSEYILVDLDAGAVNSPPAPLAHFYQGAALALLAEAGIRAVLVDGSLQDPAAALAVFRGPAVYKLENATSATPPQIAYIAQQDPYWPAPWHPVLQQAPAGAIGSLWSVGAGGVPLTNTGSGWTSVALPGSTPALALDCGADGSVYSVTAGALFQVDVSGSWVQAATPGFELQGISAGDAEHVWVTDSGGGVYRFADGAFTQAGLGTAAGDITASPDGTLWHCRAGDPHAYRYISEGQQPSEALAIGMGVTGVQKAAGSAFGAGFFLAQQGGQSALIRYTSPYLFKTGSQYAMAGPQQIAAGGSSIFLFCRSLAAGGGWDFFVVALDVQTGSERWRYAYPSSGEDYGYSPLYDSEQQLVYVFQAPGVVQALDSQTGALRWALPLPQVIPVQPVLHNSTIYIAAYDNPTVTPNSSMVYLIAVDARAAAQHVSGNQPVAASWTFSYNVPGQQVAPLPPVLFEGSVYGAVWSQANQQLQLSLLRVDALTGTGSDLFDARIFGSGTNNGGSTAPIIARLTLEAGETVGSLIVNAGTAGIYGIFLDGSGTFLHYSPQALEGNPVLTNFVTYGGAIYFCDSQGNLYGLDANFASLPGLPTTFVGSTLDATGITVVGDENDQAVVIAGDIVSDTLCFYSTATGNLLTLPTNQTAVTALSDVTHEGIVYAGGTTTDSLGQVFAIRASDVSALRDFVIESQLLQDFDPGHQAVARYQTHITIVDGAQSPQPFTSVKVWADAPLAVQIDGTPYTVGPNTPAATQVDATGALTIISDATDLFATPLRIWAAFMDPFERIVIYPDREFHGRMPAMTADPTNDDPTMINLATGKNYGGTTVFPNQQQAEAVATVVSTTCQRAGISGSGGSSTQTKAAGAAASLPPYSAYADLPGMQYIPYNTPASRPAVAQAPYGTSWSSDTPTTYATLPFAAAAGAIDGLAGEVDPSLGLPAPIGSGLGSIFSHLWHKIKSGAVKVTKVIVSIGTAVYAGIQYVEDGVTKVLRFVVRQIEDLAATVGAFFMALGKAIADIIELLSLLLHFEEVVETHNYLKAALLQQINALPQAIQTVIRPAVNTYFAHGENAITQAFCTVKQQIDTGFTCSSPDKGTSPAINSVAAVHATAHTVFSAAPKTGGSPKSHAVTATWGFDKIRSHYKQATTGAAGVGPAAAAGNPILDFVSFFSSSLASDPTLQQAYKTTLNDFAATFAFKSSTQFLATALFDLLDIIQDLLVSSLAIGKAFFDGFLAAAGDMVSFLIDPQQGILVQPLNIPILSDLYQWLFGSELTFLDLILLAASIPVTFLYRIIEGKWLSEEITGEVIDHGVTAAQVTLTPLARALGLLNTAFFVGRAFLMPINDTTGEPGAPNPITYYSLAVISCGFFATTMLKAAKPSDIIFVATSLGLIITPYFLAGAPAVAAFLALVRIGAFIYDMAASPPSIDTVVVLVGNLLGSLPALAQPLKYLDSESEEISLAILLFIELGANLGAAFDDFAYTTANWDVVPTALPPSEEPMPNWAPRLHLPFVQAGP